MNHTSSTIFKMTYVFWNSATDEEIDVEADGFEEAAHIMFGDGEYDYNEWQLIESHN